MRLLFLFVCAGCCLLFTPAPAVAQGAVDANQQPLAPQTGWYVDAATGNDGNTCQSPGAACKTIGAAVVRSSAGDVINVAAGTYHEHGLVLDKNLTLLGAGSAVTLIDGGLNGRVLQTTAQVTIDGVTIRNGRIVTPSPLIFDTGGAGILAGGALTLRNSVVMSNSVIGSGGAIFNTGNLVIDNSAILSNTSEGSAGGIYGYLGTITISRTLLAGNATTGQTGGALESGRPVYMTDVTIRDNTAGSFGGGLVTYGATVLNRVTLQGNRALSGAAIFAQVGGITLTNVTVSHNIAANNAGGIQVSGELVSLYLQNSTVAYNGRTNSAGTGFNGLLSGGSHVRIVNTIFAHNDDRNCGGTDTNWTSAGHNLADDTSCAFTGDGDLQFVDPQLGDLAGYGGATLTHALLPGSPAIDAGDAGACLSVDQRQVARPLDGDGDMTAVCDIGAFEARQQLSIADVTVVEGTGGTTTAAFTVTLTPAAAQPVTVDYTTVAGSAQPGSDFAAIAATLTFNPGQTVKLVNVQVTGDANDEADETFTVQLSNAANADIIDTAATGTIVDDDGLSTLTIGDRTLLEGNSGATAGAVFTVTLSPASSQAVSVAYSTANGTATAGEDYDAAAGNLVFDSGQTVKTITVLVRGDVFDEGDAETFAVNLANASGATIDDATGAGVITDDDTARLSLSFGPVVNEGDSGLTPALFTVELSTPAAFTITVDYETSSGIGETGASAGVDFEATAGTLTIPIGDTARTFTVQIIGDESFEQDELFQVLIRNGTVPIQANVTFGHIVNDDGPQIYLPIMQK